MSSSELEMRGVGWIVAVRRGGEAREEAIRAFYEAKNEKNEPAVSWWIHQMVSELSNTTTADRDDIEIQARKGFVKALDTYVYRPGTSFVKTLSRHVKMCIRSEVYNIVRAGLTKSASMVTSSIDDDDAHEPSVNTIDEVDTKLVISQIESRLTEDEQSELRRVLEALDAKSKANLGDLFMSSIRDKSAEFLPAQHDRHPKPTIDYDCPYSKPTDEELAQYRAIIEAQTE